MPFPVGFRFSSGNAMEFKSPKKKRRRGGASASDFAKVIIVFVIVCLVHICNGLAEQQIRQQQQPKPVHKDYFEQDDFQYDSQNMDKDLNSENDNIDRENFIALGPPDEDLEYDLIDNNKDDTGAVNNSTKTDNFSSWWRSFDKNPEIVSDPNGDSSNSNLSDQILSTTTGSTTTEQEVEEDQDLTEEEDEKEIESRQKKQEEQLNSAEHVNKMRNWNNTGGLDVDGDQEWKLDGEFGLGDGEIKGQKQGLHNNRNKSQVSRKRSRRQHQHHKNHHHHHQSHHQAHHRRQHKERYQKKLNKAMKMQIQREQKLERQEKQKEEFDLKREQFYTRDEDSSLLNRQFSSVDDIDQHIDGVNKEKYPNLARLHSQLQKDREDEMPPYIRKYNRRNKQLMDLLEGTISPEGFSHRKHHHHHHSHKNHHARRKISHKEKLEHWIEENLFEEQRHNPNKIVRPPDDPDFLNVNKINELPGETDSHSSPEDSNHQTNNIPNRSSTRAGNFVYHRIAQPQPSNSIGQAFGVIVRKPGLPFVAITDRRQGPQTKNRSKAFGHVENKMP